MTSALQTRQDYGLTPEDNRIGARALNPASRVDIQSPFVRLDLQERDERVAAAILGLEPGSTRCLTNEHDKMWCIVKDDLGAPCAGRQIFPFFEKNRTLDLYVGSRLPCL